MQAGIQFVNTVMTCSGHLTITKNTIAGSNRSDFNINRSRYMHDVNTYADKMFFLQVSSTLWQKKEK